MAEPVTPAKTPTQRGVRTFVQSVGAAVVAFLYGLWQLPGVSDYTHHFIQTQGLSLLVGLAVLVGVPAGVIAYVQNRIETKKTV
jgi:hypothetical protein